MTYSYESTRAQSVSELKENLSCISRIWLFFTQHRKLSCVLGLVIFAAIIFCASFFASPDEAEAIPAILVGIAVVAGVTALAGVVVGDASDSLSEMLRTGVNGLLDISQTMIATITSTDGLTKSFTNLIDGAYPIIQSIFTATVVPLGYVTLSVFLVFSLCKILQTMGQHDTGVDVWRIMFVFIMFAFGKLIIDNSWYILIGIYELFNSFISAILENASMVGTFGVVGLEDDFANAGLLLICLIVALLAFVITVGVTAIVHFVLIMRAIQIYVYTCFAPIPLACMISESGRSVATGFIKSYIAIIFSGAILALLISMFAYIVGTITVTSSPTDGEGVILWCCELLLNLVVYFAFGWSMLKSGTWARDFVGLAG